MALPSNIRLGLKALQLTNGLPYRQRRIKNFIKSKTISFNFALIVITAEQSRT
jgi:hypothetical protein